MISARAHHAIRQLTRRRGRSILTIVTIAVAIAGVWMFAIPGNVRAILADRVETDAMHTVRLAPNAAPLDADQLARLRAVDNVAALDTRTLARDDMRVDGRVEGVILVGVDEFEQQSVNIVSLEEGQFPERTGQLVSDASNSQTGRLGAAVGDTIELRTHTGSWQTFEIRGRGGTVRYSSEVANDAPVLYLTSRDVQRIMGYPAANSIDVLAADRSPGAVDAMVNELRMVLADELPDISYWDVLEVWRPGTWPGSDDFGNFVVVFYTIAIVALVAALVLIVTTMNTVVREQTREIGLMKAIGGTPRAIAGSYLSAALLLGAIGTVIGVGIGIPFSNWLMQFMSSEFGGTSVGWVVSGLALFLSLALGLGGTMLASMPAVRHAARITVHQAIEDHGVLASYGTRTIDRAAARIPLTSRRSKMGIRNATRRAGRTVSTAVPIGLAIATLLGFASVLITAVDEDLRTFDLEGADLILWDRFPGLDARAGELIDAVTEVAFAHPMTYSSVELDGEKYVWGLPAVSTYDHELIAGRWYTEEEDLAAARVVVVGEATANQNDIDVGETMTVETRGGPLELEVVGIDGQLVNNGQGLFIPFNTVLDYEGRSTGNWWVRTIDRDPATVDAAATAIHETLESHGYQFESSRRYIDRGQNVRENRLIVTVVMAMGLPVVAIGMIGLISATASNVLDRTREIGILRSIGARRRDLRVMFRVEALVIGVLGWLMGIPTGYALARLILYVFERRFDAAFRFQFPLWTIAVSLAVTLAMTVIVMRFPLRRAVRLAPGVALRYE
jgi:putative ABC transport system permease protein